MIKLLKDKNKLFLLFILLIAALLRLYKISGYMEFLGDQGRDVIIVHKFLTNGDLMFIGPQTSIGNMYLGPWYYYLIAPFLLLFNFSPVGPAVMAALLGVVTVWLAYKAAKEWFNERVGLITALFLALSPVVIYYSIFSWNPNIMPFFSLVSVWLTWRIWQKREYKKLPWLGISLAMILNSHYLGLLIFPPILFFCFLGFLRVKKDRQIKKQFILHTLYFILLFLVLMSPLLLFDLKHSFVNYNAFYKFFYDRQTTVNLKWYKGFLELPKVVNQLFANFIIKKDSWSAANIFLPVLIVAALLLRKNKTFLFLLAFLVFGLLGLSNYKQHVYAHYFLFLYPFAAIIFGVIVDKLRLFAVPIIFLAVWLMISNWHGWRPANKQMEQSKNIVSFILKESKGEKFSLALIAEQNYDPPYRYFLELQRAFLVDLHEELPEQLFVICEPWGKVNCNPIGHPLWEIAAFGWAEVDQKWEVDGRRVFRLLHNK